MSNRNHKTAPQIATKYGLKYQTVQSRIRLMGIKPVEMVGGVRLFSIKQIRRIVGHEAAKGTK